MLGVYIFNLVLVVYGVLGRKIIVVRWNEKVDRE